jgi:hypothetical protein
VGRVDDDTCARFTSRLQEGVEIERTAKDVRGDDGGRSHGTEPATDVTDIDIECHRIAVDKDGPKSVPEDCVDCGVEGERRDEAGSAVGQPQRSNRDDKTKVAAGRASDERVPEIRLGPRLEELRKGAEVGEQACVPNLFKKSNVTF